ncbi:MAG: protein tyrosine phosphatase family protein [Betaproteobacteria bacterium]
MHRSLRILLLLIGALPALGPLAAAAQQVALRAPNVVEISPRLVTSGQPTAGALASLSALGFGAVIYLAPPTVSDAVKDEATIVARQGLVFVNIPINFEGPTEKDFETFAGVLGGLAGRKVLVHCQVNLRASSMVFLYRSIIAKDDPRVAYDSVTRVWAPDGPWKKLIQEQLKKHRIDFDPL